MRRRLSLSHSGWAQLILVAAAAALFWWIYRRALSYPFQFDDFGNVVHNRAIRYLGHPRIFIESLHLRERPVTNVSYALNYWWSQLSLSGFRSWNIALHIANAALVWRLGNTLLSRCSALFAAALFLLHPLAVDTVVYISARSSLLALFFQLLALSLYALPRQNFSRWLAFFVCAVSGFLAKESAAATFLLLLIMDRQLHKRAGEVLPFLVPMAVGAVVLVAMKSFFLANAFSGVFRIQGEGNVTGWVEFLRLQFSLWPRILSLFARPGLQAIDHQLRFPESWLEEGVLLGIVLVGILGVACMRQLRRPRMLYFALAWILLSLLPTNSVFPVLDPLGERHLYAALPGLVWLVAELAASLLDRRWGPVSAAAMLALLGGAVTTQRVEVWRSSASLWFDALEKYPTKYRILYNASGALIKEGVDLAVASEFLLERVGSLAPGSLDFQQQESLTDSLAGAYVGRVAADREGARKEIRRLAPGFLGDYVYLKAGMSMLPEALWLADWREARSSYAGEAPTAKIRDPLFRARSLDLLASSFQQIHGRPREALALIESVFAAFTETHMPYWTARERLVALYKALGRKRDALTQLELLVTQYKSFKNFKLPLLKELCSLYREFGDLVGAADTAGEMVRSFPDDPEVRSLYAELLAARGDPRAPIHRREAEFYSRHAVRPGEAGDAIRP